MARQVRLIAADLRQFVLLENGRRDGPGRVEGQACDTGFEQRRLPVRPAHLGTGLPDRHAILVDHQQRGRDVDQKTGGLEVLSHPAKTLQIDA